MYDYSHFKEKELQRLQEFMNAHPFIFLTGSFSDGRQVATQVPVMIEEREGKLILQGHILKHSDHYEAFVQNSQALAVFTGPHTYVSASWYTNPVSGSTWNYMSVHIYGEMRWMSEAELDQLMKKLTLRFEGDKKDSLTIYENLPEEYITRMKRAIVGFELIADRVENVFKLSQNKDEESYRSVITQLEEQGGDASLIAKEMKMRIPELFDSEK